MRLLFNFRELPPCFHFAWGWGKDLFSYKHRKQAGRDTCVICQYSFPFPTTSVPEPTCFLMGVFLNKVTCPCLCLRQSRMQLPLLSISGPISPSRHLSKAIRLWWVCVFADWLLVVCVEATYDRAVADLMVARK